MKKFADDRVRSDVDAGFLPGGAIAQSRFSLSSDALQSGRKVPRTGKYTRFFPRAIFCAMLCAVLLMDAVLPLRDLWFHEALLTQLGPWPVVPSLLLFPGWRVMPPIGHTHVTGLPDLLLSW